MTIDAHLGDALFRLNCAIHFEINRATGWLNGPLETKRKGPQPKYLWSHADRNSERRYQTKITRGGEVWCAFAPSSPDNRNDYMESFCGRINGAGWRPQGSFPHGVEMKGIDLIQSRLTVVIASGMAEGLSLRYARLDDAMLDQSHFGHYADLSYVTAERMQCHACAGGYLDFRGANLSGADFENSIFWQPNFEDAIVAETNFTGATLDSGNREHLEGAILTRVCFERQDRAERTKAEIQESR